ncbi:MAG TPA: dephospho-CoA kinase, partial [Pseudolabrys sp.]|nr:dephospho-CoA kinase [Pseudolabrys sp.]
QMPDSEKRKRADFIVDTSKGFDTARAQVREILARIATMPRRRQ